LVVSVGALGNSMPTKLLKTLDLPLDVSPNTQIMGNETPYFESPNVVH
jgi:hypothetical protein